MTGVEVEIAAELVFVDAIGTFEVFATLVVSEVALVIDDTFDDDLTTVAAILVEDEVAFV